MGFLGIVALVGFYDTLRSAGPMMILAPILGTVGLTLVTVSHPIPIAMGCTASQSASRGPSGPSTRSCAVGMRRGTVSKAGRADWDGGRGGEPCRGVIPVDPLSVKSIIRTAADDRLLADAVLRTKITNSLPIASVDINSYDIVYLAGGWGAAFDLGFSKPLAIKITEANAADKIIGSVCHGPLGLINATTANGRPLVDGRHVTGVSNRQVRDLRITHTPQHPETELRCKGALYESQHPDL
jgi:putative intracellular protease/amidase